MLTLFALLALARAATVTCVCRLCSRLALTKHTRKKKKKKKKNEKIIFFSSFCLLVRACRLTGDAAKDFGSVKDDTLITIVDSTAGPDVGVPVQLSGKISGW